MTTPAPSLQEQESREPGPCPFCKSKLNEPISGAGYYEHPLTNCVLSGMDFPDLDVAGWNRAVPPKRKELPPEWKAALDKANAEGRAVVELPSGGLMFINRGEQPEDDADLNCPACGGSGHREDVAATPVQPVVPERMAELRRLALAATPGPWSWWTSNSTLRLTGADGRDGGVLDAHGGILCSSQNRAYIAAANPATILALLDALDAAVVPTDWRLVPVEPTEGQLLAGVRAFQSGYKESDSLADWRAAYRANIAAAPLPVTQSGAGADSNQAPASSAEEGRG